MAVIIASTITGAGGGMIREVFAGRKPMIFHSEIYHIWKKTPSDLCYGGSPTIQVEMNCRQPRAEAGPKILG
ncbi:TRIC cation channel family protein [Bacillus sp. FJAT-27245]|uniref:TRIC cation channel family protein n=1 Tax=Bacillus sp. FJAT-27245 TaxID=1684144 RepID=UPI001E4AC8C6|nr:TRIC cation channel family protein [Bacillus sp. FJAT-27245]